MGRGQKGEKVLTVQLVAGIKVVVAATPSMVTVLDRERAPQDGPVLWPLAARHGDGFIGPAVPGS